MMDTPDDTDDTATEQPARLSLPSLDSFKAVRDLVALAIDPRAVKRHLRQLHDALAAVDAAQRKLVEDRAAHDEYLAKTRAEIEEQRNMAARIWETAQAAERSIAERERRTELEKAWSGLRPPGQPPEMFGTISRSPAFTGLEVAKYAAAHDGRLPEHPDAADSVRTGNDGEPFAEHTTLTRTPEPPSPAAGARVRPGRAARVA
jgi:hypothetical protein